MKRIHRETKRIAKNSKRMEEMKECPLPSSNTLQMAQEVSGYLVGGTEDPYDEMPIPTIHCDIEDTFANRNLNSEFGRNSTVPLEDQRSSLCHAEVEIMRYQMNKMMQLSVNSGTAESAIEDSSASN